MNFQGAAKRLEDIDIPRIAFRLGVGEDELHAVMDVEARGSGFDSKGRPAMLFEPHIFYRLLEVNRYRRNHAVNANVAYKTWGTRAYPKDSYPTLLKAMAIDEDLALQSASWGMGQIMGFNYALAGFASAKDMIEAFKEDEASQLDAMATFILRAGLDDELRAHDWAGFARGYNGPSYAKHGYHTRLADRFSWWKGKPDTPWMPESKGCACPCPAEVA